MHIEEILEGAVTKHGDVFYTEDLLFESDKIPRGDILRAQDRSQWSNWRKANFFSIQPIFLPTPMAA